MSHSEDLESHVSSIEEDMEYWRTKRIEPRVLRLLRKGSMSFYDIIRASAEVRDASEDEPRAGIELAERITSLELKLGEYIRGIEIATSVMGNLVLVEESREEAGVYDEGLKFGHRVVSGSVEERVSRLERLQEENILLLRSLFRVLVAKGLISEERLSEMLAAPNPPRYENGARIVAKAWLDTDFKARLTKDAKGTLRELGFALNRTPKLVVLEDTESVHNVIVCTLCSCYPYELLGNPPWWYKDDSYKRSVVKEPRRTLAEMFKLRVPEGVEVRVYDSTSDIRYMVLPRRPRESGGMGEEELAGLVTQESLIGVGETLKPALAGAG